MLTKLVLYSFLCLLTGFMNYWTLFVFASFHEGMLAHYRDDLSWVKEPEHQVIVRDGRKVTVFDKIRVELFFIQDKWIPASLDATEEQWDFVKNSAKETIEMFKAVAPETRRLIGPIRIPRLCKLADGRSIHSELRAIKCNTTLNERCTSMPVCYDTQVPPDHGTGCMHYKKADGTAVQVFSDGPGVNADLVVYFTIAPCEELANAVACQVEHTFRRPVAGRIHVCNTNLNDYMRNKPKLMPHVLFHELMHIVLHPITGTNYFDSRSKRYREETYRVEKRQWLAPTGMFEREVFLVTLPTLLKVAREHFNCPTLVGVEMDSMRETERNFNNITREPRSYPHFENRLFPDALLSPFYLEGNVITKLEVALFIDSGWYKVNESMGRPMSATRNKGCDFPVLSCYEYMKNYRHDPIKIYPYCRGSDIEKWMCSLDNRQASYCSGQYSDSSDIKAYFRLPENFVGFSQYAYCPMVVPKALTGRSPYCDYTDDIDFREVSAYGGSSSSICVRFPSLSVYPSKWHCPLSFHWNTVGVCVKYQCQNEGFLFEFGHRKFLCKPEFSGRRFSYNTRSRPYGCRIKFQFCCPDVSICTNNESFHLTEENLGRCINKHFKTILSLKIIMIAMLSFLLR